MFPGSISRPQIRRSDSDNVTLRTQYPQKLQGWYRSCPRNKRQARAKATAASRQCAERDASARGRNPHVGGPLQCGRANKIRTGRIYKESRTEYTYASSCEKRSLLFLTPAFPFHKSDSNASFTVPSMNSEACSNIRTNALLPLPLIVVRWNQGKQQTTGPCLM